MVLEPTQLKKESQIEKYFPRDRRKDKTHLKPPPRLKS